MLRKSLLLFSCLTALAVGMNRPLPPGTLVRLEDGEEDYLLGVAAIAALEVDPAPGTEYFDVPAGEWRTVEAPQGEGDGAGDDPATILFAQSGGQIADVLAGGAPPPSTDDATPPQDEPAPPPPAAEASPAPGKTRARRA